MGLAARTGRAEFILSDDEAKRLGTAYAKVARHFSLLKDPKSQDIAAAIGLTFGVFGGHFMQSLFSSPAAATTTNPAPNGHAASIIPASA